MHQQGFFGSAAGPVSAVVASAIGGRNTGCAVAVGAVILALWGGDAVAVAPPPPAPVSGWLADGDASDSFGAAVGTPGGTLAYVPGVFGQAFSFDGGAAVNLPRNAFRTLANQDTTVVAWLKTNQGADFAAVKFQDSWLIYFDSAQRGVVTGVWDDWPHRLSSGVDLRDGQWHHVASVYAAGVASVYVDGLLKASGARNRYAGCDSCGSNALGAGYFANYVGLLDDVGIYGHALTASEVQSVMSQGLAAAVPEPSLWALLLAGLWLVRSLPIKRQRPSPGGLS